MRGQHEVLESKSPNLALPDIVQTLSGRGAKLIGLAEDEFESVGMLEYSDSGIMEMRRRESFELNHSGESNTSDLGESKTQFSSISEDTEQIDSDSSVMIKKKRKKKLKLGEMIANSKRALFPILEEVMCNSSDANDCVRNMSQKVDEFLDSESQTCPSMKPLHIRKRIKQILERSFREQYQMKYKEKMATLLEFVKEAAFAQQTRDFSTSKGVMDTINKMKKVIDDCVTVFLAGDNFLSSHKYDIFTIDDRQKDLELTFDACSPFSANTSSIIIDYILDLEYFFNATKKKTRCTKMDSNLVHSIINYRNNDWRTQRTVRSTCGVKIPQGSVLISCNHAKVCKANEQFVIHTLQQGLVCDMEFELPQNQWIDGKRALIDST